MPNVNIGKQVFNLRDNLCSEKREYVKGNVSYNIYIKIPNICNANCSFCNKNKEEIPFNVEGMVAGVRQIMSKVTVSAISITGGEPFKDVVLLRRIIMALNIVAVGVPISINTNGLNLREAISLEPYVQKLHISRHHYDDEINKEMFGGANVPTLKEIKEVIAATRKNFIQLNCVLVKGYIDSIEEVEKYLDQDVYNTGFVGLMKINQFAIEHFIDYKTIFPIKKEGHLYSACYINSQFDDKELRTTCSCMNAIRLKDGHVNEYYARSVEWLQCPSNNFIIYDGQKLVGNFS